MMDEQKSARDPSASILPHPGKKVGDSVKSHGHKEVDLAVDSLLQS